MDKLIITTSEELKQLIRDSLQEALTQQRASTDLSTNAHSNSKYITVDEAARYLNLSKSTLYGRTSDRTIPFAKPGGKLFFLISELDEWLLQGKKPSRSQMRDAITGGK